MRELFVRSLVQPDADEAEFVAVLEPGGDLLDGGLLLPGNLSGLRLRGMASQREHKLMSWSGPESLVSAQRAQAGLSKSAGPVNGSV